MKTRIVTNKTNLKSPENKRKLYEGKDLNQILKEARMNGTKIMTGTFPEELKGVQEKLTGLERALEIADVIENHIESEMEKKNTQANTKDGHA